MEPLPATLRWIPALLAALLLAAPARGQDVTVRAQLSSGVVKLGGDVVLVLEVENASSARVGALPAVDGLRFGQLAGPSRRESRVIVNGRMREYLSLRWTVRILPERAGDFTLPPIEVETPTGTRATRPIRFTVVEDLRGQELLFIELRPSSEQVYEGQPLAVELVFGWDVNLNNQVGGLDLSLPWWGDLPGVLEVDGEDRGLRSRQFEVSVNRDSTGLVEEIGTRQVGGREFRLFRLAKTLLPTRAGKLSFGQSYLQFVQVVERGRRDMFGFGTRDRTETFYVGTPAFEVDVQPLPETGRPFDFSGAVGTYEVRAEVDRRDVDAGDSIKLTVEWSGAGNFEFFEVPDLARLPAFEDFRVYGYNEEKGADHRIATYDLAPTSGAVRTVPPVPLSVFDPALGEYTRVESPAIPIRVRDLAGADGLEPLDEEEGRERDIRDIVAATRSAGARRAPPAAAVGGILVAVPLGWWVLRALVRRRGDPDAPLERRRRAARRRLAADLRGARRADEQLRALHAFLAARTREPEQAWVGRDVEEFVAQRRGDGPERSGHAGDEAARALAAAVARLEAEAYGGGDQPLEAGEVRRAADAAVRCGL